MTPEEQEKKELERLRLRSRLPSNAKGDTQKNIPSRRNDGYSTTPNPPWQSGLRESLISDIPGEESTHSIPQRISTVGEGGSDTRIKTKIDEDAMDVWTNEGERFRAQEEPMDDQTPRKIDEEQNQFQAQQQATAEDPSTEIDTQLSTVLSSQRIMKGTLATAAVGGTAIGIGGLAYFVSGSDSTAFIHTIRHLIA